MMRHMLAILFILAVLVPSGQVWSADNQAQLEKEVRELRQRVSELESQLEQERGYGQNVWDPFREMERVQREMNRMFNDSFGRGLLSEPGLFGRNVFDPQADITENQTHYTVTMDIPGMEKDAVNVEIKGNTLYVSGERSETKEKTGANNEVISKERSFGHFSRIVTLPGDVKEDSIDAQYANGILTIRVEKAQSGTADAAGTKVIVR